jgi:hypothetical protein
MTRKIREFNKKLRDITRRAAKDLADTSFSERRYGPKDRRKSHTFIMNDRRSGIVDRRRKTKD